ncbi:MAG: S9 family peptidase [Cyclobacteriaceae bacterium]|nr:S9 family peptidase [Cyclobacteriaceae bacterium HetDA_MAG_MS6]
MKKLLSLLSFLYIISSFAQERLPFQELDVFQLEWVADPQISPDGKRVVYRRMGMSIMKDRKVGNLWVINSDGTDHRKLTSYDGNESSARWSPDGKRIAYTRSTDQGSEIHIYWTESMQTARITQLEKSPGSITWSSDGKQIAFTMTVAQKPPVLVQPPKKPKDAQWAKPPRVTDRMRHERDGSGYIEPGFTHILVVPSEGGSPRQVTSGNFHHRNPNWTPDGKNILFSGNRNEDWEYDFRNSEIYTVAVNSGVTDALTERKGPDHSPTVSPDGNHVAYLGFEDKVQTYQLTRLQVMDPGGSNKKVLLKDLDRSISNPIWDAQSKGIYFQYDEKGRTKIGYISLSGNFKTVADNLGGATIGRPYGGGSYSVSKNGIVAYNYTRPKHPGDLAIVNKDFHKITNLNAELLNFRELGQVEEIWYKSSFDQRDVQGWIVKPPKFDASKKYPIVVENHGGPISNYGERFSPEIQLYAAAGYVVFYPNPRGSTGYGEEFGNLLYHNYPGNDYDDVMSGMDAVIAKGYIDEKNLFVTGGSAGGIMSAWMIGKSDRFQAAAVVKPVMNWYSKTLVADNWYGYYHTRYPGLPWTNMEDYMRFSPISLVGNIACPTLVMVGMEDLRTPTSEAKQLYHALKYRKIETALVEIPGSYHNIAKRPSQLITKVAHVIAWFKKYEEK